MKKIMFSDRYGLTQAVLQGKKTMTRRIAYSEPIAYKLHIGRDDIGHVILCDGWNKVAVSRYAIGEEVAVAQCYEDAILDVGEEEWNKLHKWYCIENLRKRKGLHNKMFVQADLMPHRIKIMNIKLERLQDICEEDIYKEGFEKQAVNNGWGNAAWHWEVMLTYMDDLGRYREIRSANPQEAFACLIDNLSGYGTWENNPLVWVYTFELVV